MKSHKKGLTSGILLILLVISVVLLLASGVFAGAKYRKSIELNAAVIGMQDELGKLRAEKQNTESEKTELKEANRELGDIKENLEGSFNNCANERAEYVNLWEECDTQRENLSYYYQSYKDELFRVNDLRRGELATWSETQDQLSQTKDLINQCNQNIQQLGNECNAKIKQLQDQLGNKNTISLLIDIGKFLLPLIISAA